MEDLAALTVAERLQEGRGELTSAERRLAATLLDHYPVAGLQSITKLAEASDVSAATVSRLARKLGFAGFPEMQDALRNEVEATITNPITKHDRWAARAPDTHILNRFTDAVMGNIRDSLAAIKYETMDQVADLLSDTSHSVHIVGGRITHSLADYLFTHLQVMRPNVIQFSPSANTWPHFVLNMRPGDVLVAFDIRRYENDLLELAQMARSRDVSLVLFTDQWGSPVAQLASLSFNCRVEVPSAWDSTVVILFLLEALIAAVQARTWPDTKARMAALEVLFDQTKTFRGRP